MKKVLVIMAVLAVASVASAELLNPGFEDADLTPWQLWTDGAGVLTQVTGGAYEGAKYLDITGNTTTVAFQNAYNNGGAGAVGTEILLESYWVRNTGATAASIELGFDFVDAGFGGWWGQEITPYSVPADGVWYQYSFSTTAWAGSGVKAKVATIAGSSVDVDLAHFEIVPEPATMALLGLGGLFLRRRK